MEIVSYKKRPDPRPGRLGILYQAKMSQTSR